MVNKDRTRYMYKWNVLSVFTPLHLSSAGTSVHLNVTMVYNALQSSTPASSKAPQDRVYVLTFVM